MSSKYRWWYNLVLLSFTLKDNRTMSAVPEWSIVRINFNKIFDTAIQCPVSTYCNGFWGIIIISLKQVGSPCPSHVLYISTIRDRFKAFDLDLKSFGPDQWWYFFQHTWVPHIFHGFALVWASVCVYGRYGACGYTI